MGEIKIITENVELENALRRSLEFNPIIIGERDLTLVDANGVFASGQKRTDRAGIKLAWEHAQNPKNVVILLGLEPEWYLAKSSEDFVGLMAKANVGFCDILYMSHVLPKYQEIVSGKKREDATGLTLYAFSKKQKAIASLRHGINKVDGYGRQDWLNETRETGVTGTDEEVINYIRNWEPETAGEFAGKYLEGIFVDAYQTLFDDKWVIDMNVLEIVSKLAEETKKNVFVISDSPKSELKKLMDDREIPWPLLSKYDLRGAELEIVIDNLSRSEFKRMYQIFSQKFINVADLLSA